jgi:VWFA-related protein
MRTVLRYAALALLLAAAASAQVKESITVSYVEVPVTVVDRAGNPVRGLQGKDFEVLDQGKARAIRSFDVVDFASPESVTAISPLNPVARRNFLLLFDLTFSSPETITRAQAAAGNFLKTMVGPRDLVGVATIDIMHGFRLLSAFTTDRRLIVAAIEDPRSFRGFDPLQIAAVSPLESLSDLPDASTGDSNKFGATDELKDMLRGAGRSQDENNRANIDRQVSLLTGMATTLRAVSGQKHVVFLSEGFDPRLMQGREASGGQSEKAFEKASIESGQLWNVDNDNRYGSSKSISLLTMLTDAAKRSDVILDAVDIHGLRSNLDPRKGVSPQSNEGLHLLADSTGGRVFQNSNDLSSDFGRILKAQEVVYILGFQAPVQQPGKFHALNVRVTGVPGARVSARTGYYEPGGENRIERSLTNAEVVLNDIPQDAIHVAALAAAFPTTGPKAQVPVILEVNGPDLIAADKGSQSATLGIFIYAFDETGVVGDSIYQRASLDLAKLGGSLKNGVKYYATLSLPPGHYAIKSLVTLGETGKRGFARNDVVVPKGNDFAVSQPLFFEEPGRWLMLKGGSHDRTDAAYPFAVAGKPFIPSAGVRIRSGEPRTFAIFVQNAAPDDLSVVTTPRATMAAKGTGSNGSLFVFRLDSVEPKDAAMNVTVQKRGGESQTSSVPIATQ